MLGTDKEGKKNINENSKIIFLLKSIKKLKIKTI